MKQTRISPADWGVVPVDPDPGFDPEHNRRVIAETIRKSERARRMKNQEFGLKIDERAEAIAKYLKDIETNGASSSILKYFGRRELARLRGEEIRDILKGTISHAKKQEAIEKAKLQKAVA